MRITAALVTVLCLCAMLFAQETKRQSYTEYSKTHGLDGADTLMRKGKYLEAAVAYRNALFKAGDREGIRIPLSLALIGNGDFEYSGVEIRRAQSFFKDFETLRPDAALLFPSRSALIETLRDRDLSKLNADELAGIAYAWMVLDEKRAALGALAYYARHRGDDEFVVSLRHMMGVRKSPKPSKPKESAVDNDEMGRLEHRVNQIPIGTASKRVKAGRPRSAGVYRFTKSMVIRKAVFEE